MVFCDQALQREKFNENYCRKLSATVENLLLESNKRLQIHLEEKKAAMEEKVSTVLAFEHRHLL